MIVSLVNVKGGVGKTTTAVNVAAAFAETGLEVLLVDLDPQGSASYSVGVPFDAKGPRIGDVLLRHLPVAEALRPTRIEGLHLLPGDLALATAESRLPRTLDLPGLLALALKPVRRRFDCIVIDGPPGLGLYTQMALRASQAYLVPVNPHQLALDALDKFFEGVEQLKGELRRATQLLGVVLTMVDHRVGLTAEIAGKIRKRYGNQVLRTEIPINVRLAEAPGYGQTIFEFERWSAGALAYRKLAGEILRRMRQRGLL